MTDSNQPFRLIQTGRDSKDIFGPGSRLDILKKAILPKGEGDTNQGVSAGTRTHLINKATARELRDFNAVHATCLDAKASSTVGLGHRDEGIHDALDPLCDFSWQDTLDALADDYWETGECFLEVVRDETDPTKVLGLHHIESTQIHVEVEEDDNAGEYHYVVYGETGRGETTVMARFGDLTAMRERYAVAGPGQRSVLPGTIVNSEVIHIRQSNNRSRYYGYPDYMSAVPSIELVQCMTQHEFDYYFNRGVPEFLLFLIGQNISKESWEKIEKMIQANQGLGNSHKTGAAQIPGTPEDVQVQVERLGMEDSGSGGFSDKSMTLDLRIATAHGVPPILANILLPGKIGASNEGPNALHLIQKRKIGKAQRNFSRILAATLGAPETQLATPDGSVVKVTADQFLGRSAKPKPNPMDPQGALGTTDENGMPIFNQPGNGFKTILDGMTLGAQDTLARMREPLAGSGRNPEDGLLEGADDREESDPRRTR